jgi:hypothetical protein
MEKSRRSTCGSKIHNEAEEVLTMTQNSQPHLTRGFGLLQATALNMSNVVGVGPFITIPLMMATMGGPQAMLGWILGAVLAICDGQVWSELGAAWPGSGGSYRYLRGVGAAALRAEAGILLSSGSLRFLERIFPLSVGVGSTLTGEHGVGLDKINYMTMIFSEADLEAMARVRAVFDPKGLCNPGKVLPVRRCNES